MKNSAQFRYASAITRGDADEVRSTLKEGANPDLGPYGEKTFFPLDRVLSRIHYIENGLTYLRILNLMMDFGANPFHLPPKYEHGALSYLVPKSGGESKRNWPLAMNLVLSKWNRGVDWKQLRNADGENLLASCVHCPEMLEVLLRNGMDPDSLSDYGKTALMFAVNGIEEYPASVALLMSYGANPYIKDNFNTTAMTLALDIHQPKAQSIVQMVEHGYNVIEEPDLSKFKAKLKRFTKKLHPNHVEVWEALGLLNKQLLHYELTKKASSKRPDLCSEQPKSKPRM